MTMPLRWIDPNTVALSDLSFALLYAVILTIYRVTYRRLQPGIKGFDYFIASNVVLAAGLASAAAHMLSHKPFDAAFLLLILASHLLLHRGFAEILEQPGKFWLTQIGVLGLGALVWLTGTATGTISMGSTLAGGILPLHLRPVVVLIWGVQFALIATMLLTDVDRRSTTVRLYAAGVFTFYALCQALWFFLAVLWPHSGAGGMKLLLTVFPLLAHGAIAFAFFGVAHSRMSGRLVHQAERDELTGLLNRRAIRQGAALALAKCKRKGGSISILMIDVDGLKRVNDGLGHEAGDALLRSVGRSLRSVLRDGDLLARMGGDEFCVLLPGTDELEAGWVADRCRRTIQMLDVDYHLDVPRVSASLGVAHSSDCSANWEDLLRRSDAAMYEAKADGGDSVVVARKAQRASLLRVDEQQRLQRVR